MGTLKKGGTTVASDSKCPTGHLAASAALRGHVSWAVILKLLKEVGLGEAVGITERSATPSPGKRSPNRGPPTSTSARPFLPGKDEEFLLLVGNTVPICGFYLMPC